MVFLISFHFVAPCFHFLLYFCTNVRGVRRVRSARSAPDASRFLPTGPDPPPFLFRALAARTRTCTLVPTVHFSVVVVTSFSGVDTSVLYSSISASGPVVKRLTSRTRPTTVKSRQFYRIITISFRRDDGFSFRIRRRRNIAELWFSKIRTCRIVLPQHIKSIRIKR